MSLRKQLVEILFPKQQPPLLAELSHPSGFGETRLWIPYHFSGYTVLVCVTRYRCITWAAVYFGGGHNIDVRTHDRLLKKRNKYSPVCLLIMLASYYYLFPLLVLITVHLGGAYHSNQHSRYTKKKKKSFYVYTPYLVLISMSHIWFWLRLFHTIVIRTHDRLKKMRFPIRLQTILGSDYYVPLVLITVYFIP